MSNIVVNGCSHSIAWGFKDHSIAWPHLLFPNCVNLAKCGDSNIGIARRTLEYLVCHPNVSHVFIMWTDNNRVEFSSDDNRHLTFFGNLSWGSRFDLHDLRDPLNDFVPKFYKYFYSKKYNLKLFLLYLHHIKLFCELRGIKFLCTASMEIELLDNIDVLLEEFHQLMKIHPARGDLNFSPPIEDQNHTSEVESFIALTKETQSVWIDKSYTYGHASILEPKYWVSESDKHANQAGHELISKKLYENLPADWQTLCKTN